MHFLAHSISTLISSHFLKIDDTRGDRGYKVNELEFAHSTGVVKMRRGETAKLFLSVTTMPALYKSFFALAEEMETKCGVPTFLGQGNCELFHFRVTMFCNHSNVNLLKNAWLSFRY